MKERLDERRNRSPDHAVRVWAELAIIEQGTVGIIRHFKSLICARADGAADRYTATRPSSREAPPDIA